MPRVDLRVPFEDKDEAKRLGARWDASVRAWYVPDALDPEPFARWLPSDDGVNVRSNSYFIATSTRRCWRCGADTRIHGFILPGNHEALYDGDEPDEDIWEHCPEPSLPCYLDYLPPAVVARMHARTRHFRIGYSAVTQTYYWMNFCEHCDAKLGDHETFCEPGQGFLAFTLEDAARVTLSRIDEPFEASCGSYSVGVVLFEHMRHA